MKNYKKYLVITTLANFLLVYILVLLLNKFQANNVTFIIIILMMAIEINLYFLIRDIDKNSKAEILEKKIIYLEEYNDNLNLEAKKYKEIIENYYDDLTKGITNKVIEKNIDFENLHIKTGCPPLDSLLRTKYIEGKNKAIKMIYNLDLVENSILDAVDFCSIVGNLLDNAIYYSKDYGQKEIVLNIESKKSLKIKIQNPADPLPKEVFRRIFHKGFSTKGNKGDGMGLFIVKNIVEKNKGTIVVNESNGYINFIIEILKWYFNLK